MPGPVDHGHGHGKGREGVGELGDGGVHVLIQALGGAVGLQGRQHLGGWGDQGQEGRGGDGGGHGVSFLSGGDRWRPPGRTSFFAFCGRFRHGGGDLLQRLGQGATLLDGGQGQVLAEGQGGGGLAGAILHGCLPFYILTLHDGGQFSGGGRGQLVGGLGIGGAVFQQGMGQAGLDIHRLLDAGAAEQLLVARRLVFQHLPHGAEIEFGQVLDGVEIDLGGPQEGGGQGVVGLGKRGQGGEVQLF
eukprot:TRINITY_DN7287_c0_g1_i3.p4 TRINITY_DN7287_c0_g1~~TRINITY_DN7287_c0_g1_i3.p4  ORF type:complete len:245 (+),score=-15.40 TRINITY_DN7287_c0_g1_i3:1639-2373(+)